MKVLIVDGPGRRPESYPRIVGAELHRLGFVVIVHPMADVHGSWAGRRAVRRQAREILEVHQPDVAHVLSSEPWVADAFAGRGVPVIHSTEDKPSRADWIMAPSQAALERLREAAGPGLDGRTARLPYAAEIAEEEPGTGDHALVRVDPGDAEALRWVREAAWLAPSVPLREEGDLREARFAVCVSSCDAAWPAGVAEAMGAGRAVIASWNGAAPELVVEGQTGFLSAPGDVESLAAHMEYLWDRPEEALRMGLAALEEARHSLGVEAHVRALLRAYRLAGSSRLAV